MSHAGHSQKHLHAIGIGGIGVSALARHFLTKGWKVSGCDVSSSAVLEGVDVLCGHDPAHIDRFRPDMLVYSPAVSEDHPELLRAREDNVPLYSYPEALGLISKELDTIAVSGTHGKSTTTALLAHIFTGGKKDPVAIVGARVPEAGFEENYRKGSGNYFIVEACEYRRGMLDIHPKSAIITNIEADHLDYYRDLADITQAFVDYATHLPKDGVLVYNAEDPQAVVVARETHARTISFGLTKGDFQAKDIRETTEGMTARIVHQGKELGTLITPLVGVFNMMNTLAATSMAVSYGIAFDDIVRAVKDFRGIGRRFEFLGEISGTPVFSDYAHHPTALRLAHEAAEAKFGKGNVLAIFQPHQIDRTKKLRQDFESVFRSIPHLYLPEIYFVPGREHAGDFTAKLLADAVNVGRTTDPVRFFSTLEEMTEDIITEAKKCKAILFIGAGTIDRYARTLLRPSITKTP